MNSEIIKGQIRSFIIAISGIIGGFLMSPEQYAGIAPIIGVFATMAAAFVWSGFSHTEANAVAVVAAIAQNPESPVRGVLTESTNAGHELAESISGPIAVVGTAAADRIVKR